ncbi:alpha-protein kinase 1 isoform X2 [Seriola aureovittata]|nr:alpha-protein kinase 1 isoform X2 [Seriola aureovittata]XP_056225570.1 alpha-protein kinase 1 isoform X2 [Seriola aureovittata]XP_056225571.1 alpha-protein kinase 1 isoform X2 [Seriola aureovittata]XP_056225572.1 alpha-protein kinase 1 isoform X2 [Seriola aureovittata]
MDSQEVGGLLEECFRAAAAAAQQSIQPTEAERLNHCSCRDSLCAELASLLEEAMEMKWPFMPEKWQYKLSVGANDKTNLSDLISKHLPQLLAVLKASIVAQEARTALAVVFLVDRFLYWTDESSRLLNITKLLHRRHPDTPVAPQLVIRQARVYLNSGKLQKAEYILNSLINNSGATGCWVYHSDSDRALVQAVSVQVRGMILQKLGLWLEAAELIWASLVGYFSLPQPDKKGIGTSLGILANILVSMNDEDFHAFRTNPDIEFKSLLGDGSHRLLSAAQAAKMAVVYSQYTSLYVLTNVATQGTCLLSYSFSVECPDSQREFFLLQSREAFAIGLLTKAEGEQVTSKQELHTFLKAAYSLTVAHKWLGTPQEVVAQATQACQKALASFYDYCHAENQVKDSLCAEIMKLVSQVKLLLRVEPFLNSDKGSFIPDSYRNIEDTSVNFTLEGFTKVMQRFQKYNASLCDTTNPNCKGTKDEIDGARLCITALWTTPDTLNTECSTEACKVSKGTPTGEEPHKRGSNSSVHPPQKPDTRTTQGTTDDLGSSWQNLSLSGSGSSWPSSSGYAGSSAIEGGANARNQSCVITEVDDERSDSMLKFTDENEKQESHGCNSAASSHTVPRSAIPATSSSDASSDSEKFEVIQAGIETLGTEDCMIDAAGVAQNPTVAEGAPQSLSQLTLRSSSSSLSDSFGSQSSWEKISADLNPPTTRKPQPSSLPKAGTGQSSKSSESDGNFFLLETLDYETSDSVHDVTYKNPTSGWEFKASSKPQPLESLNVYPNTDTEVDSVYVKPPNNGSLATPHPNLFQCAPTETSTESSFEMLEESQSEHQRSEGSSTEKVNGPQRKNPSCYSCLKHSIVDSVVPKQQYLLSQKDYEAVLAGICHDCLLKRLHSDEAQFKLKEHRTAYCALHLKFSKAKGLWTARETCVYIGALMGMKGGQRETIWVQFLHQEERLSSYVGKDYLKPKQIQFHLKDVERQMTAQYYVTEFNKSLFDRDVMAQIFFIPSEALLILNGNEIVGCVTVEPYMLGDFVKLTNNSGKKDDSLKATKYGLAFGHFTYQFSGYQEVVVDLQGWVTANGKGLTYLTDPQIHSTKTPKGPSNFGARGLRYFLEEQHGPECNGICQLLKLPPVVRHPHVVP